MAHPPRPPTSLQPRLKAGATSTSVTPGVRATAPQLSGLSPISRQSSPTSPISGSDASDRATAALVRRVLCPYVHAGSTEPRPIEELLPPLTSSNEIDLQLYAIIAVVVKELVHSWYGKITPDQSFVEEVVSIIAHCTRALEGRLRNVDLKGLILDEIPELLERHVLAYRISHPPTPPPLALDPHVIYHNLNPHPALSPIPDPTKESTVVDQARHEMAYRQLLVQGALAVLLPTEDLENVFLRTLVADVIGETILGNWIGGKASEGWFIWGNISKIVDVIKPRLEHKASGEKMENDTRNRLEKFGLLSERGQSTDFAQNPSRSICSKLVWQILQYAYLTFLAIRFMILGLALGLVATYSPSPHLPSSRIAQGVESAPIAKTMEPPKNPRPILDFKIFSLVSILLNIPLRMPWLSGSFSLIQYQLIHGPLKVGATNGLLNQYLHHLLTTHLHPPALLSPLLSTLRTILFPNSALPAPSSPPPSSAQQLALKRACARSLISLFPPFLLTHFFGAENEDEVMVEVERELDVWGDAYLNRHLAYQVLELVVVRVLPEIGEKGVSGLMEGRLGEA